jgi:transcriptional regulator with XRE-family HTH domain
MPKVYLSENERLNARIAAWVYGQMGLHKITQRKLADEMGITQQAICQKLQKQSFDVTDFACFVRIFKPESEELMRLLGA